ncbi:MAG: pimeloyl-ACP methyl ester carboxylesterase [Paracoccaceae bacterium]|jgi:pimeloyl-ACP methyl ester carboxylesterase
MSKDPIGLFGRMNALSLMLITPEFYNVRRRRSCTASKIDYAPAEFTMKPETLQLDGLSIRYARAGKSDGPTILFLSPLPQSILCYDAVWASLAPEANLIALDMPGFGKSEGGMEYMSFAAQSAFLEKFVIALDLSDIHIVAPDVAMPVALHYVIHRDHKAKSIAIGDGPGILPSADGSLIRKIVGYGFWRTLVNMTGMSTFIAGATYLGYLHYSPKAAEVTDYMESYAGRARQVTSWFKSYPEATKEIDPSLDTLDVPVQVFWGDQDAFLKTDNANRLHARLPKSALTIFENCGHFCYQDKSAEFSAMMSTWVKDGHKLNKTGG